MLTYRIIWVGRNAADPLLQAAAAYRERLSHYAKVEMVQVKDSDAVQESRAILAHVQDHVIALDPRGRELSTAAWVQATQALQHKRCISFVIGGADGLHAEVLARAQERWSLSQLTFPHRLAQVILLEQLYRVHTVLRGEKYHRA